MHIGIRLNISSQLAKIVGKKNKQQQQKSNKQTKKQTNMKPKINRVKMCAHVCSVLSP